MTADSVLPRGENLRRAVKWLGERAEHTPEAVEEAARRFDLSPLEEDFLLRHFVIRKDG